MFVVLLVIKSVNIQNSLQFYTIFCTQQNWTFRVGYEQYSIHGNSFKLFVVISKWIGLQSIKCTIMGGNKNSVYSFFIVNKIYSK